jgi:hypothetical protein
MYSLPWSNFNLLIDKKVKEAVSKLQQFYFPWSIQIAIVACAPSLYDKTMVKLVPIPSVPQSLCLVTTGRERAETSLQQTICCLQTTKHAAIQAPGYYRQKGSKNYNTVASI